MVFRIKDLNCSYSNSEQVVLQIKELIIPRGKLTFVIGKSGVGKSTFLETIGMMSNTLANTGNKDLQSEFIFLSGENTTGLNLKDYWMKDENLLANLRKKFFSFLFQNTNLMESMTVYENIMLPQLMSEVAWETAEDNTREILNELNLQDFSKETKINNISGGQKQRVAFCRALAKPFTVLFGDEPTGNLDEINAQNLMQVLKNNIKESKSAIIVSHDLDLALQFADNIVLIRTHGDDNNKYGIIDASSSFLRNNKFWTNGIAEFSDVEMKLYLTNELKN
jgi:putative ABC transport system ATP-binding protein